MLLRRLAAKGIRLLARGIYTSYLVQTFASDDAAAQASSADTRHLDPNAPRRTLWVFPSDTCQDPGSSRCASAGTEGIATTGATMSVARNKDRSSSSHTPVAQFSASFVPAFPAWRETLQSSIRTGTLRSLFPNTTRSTYVSVLCVIRKCWMHLGLQQRPRYSNTQDAGCPSSAEASAEARHEATSLLEWLAKQPAVSIYAG